ncbi:MAG TPA: thiamine phosphate synthase [Rhodospirillales bacterium]|jgi:thiamine-phosphate pyrophosphorylase|nr:MAG: Thiamine-phosphate synthase [Alphaproteobacteria bacterium MarineAlpha3_Bin2]HIM25775.1 thiamine phosphate synthase [Rhodospirillales bacterium]
MDTEPCRLYLITPPSLDTAVFPDVLAAALDGGDVAAVQLRLKDATDDGIRRTAEAIAPVCSDRGVPLIMNDRPDLAAETGCDGVHIGQQDASYADARRAVGEQGIVGVTCHESRHLGMEAAEQGADYVAFGAFFPTATKQARTAAEVDILEWWSELMVVPAVAIGGITTENCRPLIRAGADFLAVVSGVWDHPKGPAPAVRDFNVLFAEGR